LRSPAWVLHGVWLLAVAPCVRAQSQQVELDAALPPQLASCVTPAQLNESYQRARSAYGDADTPAQDVQLRAAVTSRGGPDATTLLQIAAFDADRALGTRELPIRTNDCAALPDALGLVLALMTRDAAPAPAPEHAVDPQSQATKYPTHYLALGITAGAVFGTLPSSAFSLQLQAATPGDHISLRLKAGLLWPQRRPLAEGSIEMRSYELALELCGGVPAPVWSRLWLRLCGGPRIALVLGRGRDFAVENSSADELAVYVGLTPEVALQLAPATWLQFAAGAALAALRPRFQIGIESGRRSVELAYPALLRVDLGLSVVQIF